MAAVAVATLAGCTAVIPDDRPAPTGIDGFYAQTLDWTDCDADGVMQCATASAPISWASPEDGAIELALVKHPATGTAQGSLLLNPGGPGGSGWDYVYYSGDSVAGAPVMENFDVIGWDPRGVGQSTPVICYTDNADKDESLYGTYDSAYDTQGWLDELAVEETAFGEACEQNTGELLGNIDAASNARDMDMLREVLGDEKLNYLGYSYGTYFGAVYAALFPDRVGRLVLDGAVDPLVSDFESLKFQMAGFDSAYRAYAASVAPANAQGLIDDTRAVLDGIDARALVNADGRVLDSATLATGIIENLYSESYWPEITAMFAGLEQDDPSLAFTAADQYNGRNADGSYASNGNEVYVSATCVDGDFAADTASTLDRIAEIDAAAPILGKYATYDDFAVLDTACSHWPFPHAVLPTDFSAPGSAPIIVIGTTNDPATPYASSVSLAQQLSSGVLVSYTGEGHTIYNQGVSCIDDVIDAYFVSGTVPAADPQC